MTLLYFHCPYYSSCVAHEYYLRVLIQAGAKELLFGHWAIAERHQLFCFGSTAILVLSISILPQFHYDLPIIERLLCQCCLRFDPSVLTSVSLNVLIPPAIAVYRIRTALIWSWSGNTAPRCYSQCYVSFGVWSGQPLELSLRKYPSQSSEPQHQLCNFRL